jgi:transposase
MAGRKSKYTPELVKQITDVLAGGATIRDACAHVGISEETYFQWVKKPEFSEATTYAQQQARLSAVLAIKQAVRGVQQTSHTTESFTETRTRLNKKGEVVPYDYKRTATKQTVTNLAPDWRAAIEYLKRRDPEHWSERQQIDMTLKGNVELLSKIIHEAESAGVSASDIFNDILAEISQLKQSNRQTSDSEAAPADDGRA